MDILVPISICVILPVSIVLIVFIAAMNSDNKRANILIKAIESNNGIDADKLAESLQKPKKTEREILNMRLLRGCIFSLVGLALVITGLVNLATGSDFSSDPVSVPVMFGGIAIAVGISYLIVYRVSRRQMTKPDENR
ncbi:MAG: hypothetical protein HFJ91_03195 [Muribaculaceae bacterium]|nr:hypothetical protein [Muribaculaceae bacterium]